MTIWTAISLFLVISLCAFFSLVKAYSKLRSDFTWWKYFLTPKSEISDHPERYFQPEGIFWMKVAKALIASLFIITLVLAAIYRVEWR